MPELPTDAELVARAAGGDRQAFQHLFDRHRDRVAAACRQRLRGSSDVDDAVQEAFARALAKLPQLKEPERFASWVTTIAIRVCTDHHRASRRTVVLDLHAEAHADLEDTSARPDDLVLAAEHSASVRATFAALGERDREALILRHVADAPVSVVASRLGLTEGSTRVLLTRARHRLRAATSALPALVPVSWRHWLREHLPAATPTMEAMAVVVALGVAAGTVLSTPPERQPAPAVAAAPVATAAAADTAKPARKAGEGRARAAQQPAAARRAASRGAPAAPDRAQPPRTGRVAVVAEKVQVRDEYPQEDETQELADVTVFSGGEEADLRLYADEVTGAAREATSQVIDQPEDDRAAEK